MESENFWHSRRAVGLWLLAIAALIMAMVTIGGLTRLTGSGLSITQWDLLTGVLPPLSDAAWADVFRQYQQIPQYRLENLGMSLEAFKGIFWWEWSHRFLGRLVGIVYFVPLVWFAVTGVIRRRELPRMVALFLLLALQGVIGWWMVTSGLETRVSVSQYRLAIHLGGALLLLGGCVWMALKYLRVSATASHAKRGLVFVMLVYCQMLLGALVAGLHAGLVYNTWPDMNGHVFPENPFFAAPWWINFFENDGLAQFDHRIGAYIVAGFAAFIWWKGRGLAGLARRSANAVAHITLFQIVLGITTLLLVVPEPLAALHQVTAATLFCAAVWHVYELRHARV